MSTTDTTKRTTHQPTGQPGIGNGFHRLKKSSFKKRCRPSLICSLKNQSDTAHQRAFAFREPS
jgi:hypothetical protein